MERQRIKLSDCCDEISERVDNPSKSGYERFVGLEHMQTREATIHSWGSTNNVTSAMKLFQAGDVLVARRNVYLERAAKADFDGVCSGDAIVLRPRNAPCLSDIIPFILNTDEFWTYVSSQADGSMSKRISVTKLMDYEFALPPLEEQMRIVELLWAADEACVCYQDALNSAYLLRAAIRADEFSPHSHTPKLLVELCDKGGIQIGPFGAQLHQSDYVERGVPVVMPADMIDEQISLERISRIEEEKAQELSIHRVQVGDILLPRRGELNRRTYINDDSIGWLCGTGTIRVRVKNGVSSRAVFHSIASVHTVRWLNGNAVGTTMPNLNSTIVGRILVALPPEPRQGMVVECLDELQQGIQGLKDRLTQARQVKSKLLNQVGSAANGVQ